MKLKNKKEKCQLFIICFVLLVLSLFLIRVFYEGKIEEDSRAVKEYINDDILNKNNKFNIKDENESEIDTNVLYESERINKVKELQVQNEDIVGWLEIPNTNISYPILQGIDNSYYMNHNYQKKYTRNGSLFLDKDYNWNKPSENLLVYGHNNRGTKEMFVELLNYKDKKFYEEHPIVRFSTEKEDAIYEIFAIFLSRVYYKRETNVFRYYYFIDAENEDQFNYYVSECKKASIYETNIEAKYGEQLITLSTCDYSQKDGRFVVVARKSK